MSKIKKQIGITPTTNKEEPIAKQYTDLAYKLADLKQSKVADYDVEVSKVKNDSQMIDIDKDDENSNNKSRFQPWNLVQGAENCKVERETAENRNPNDKNLQLSNQLHQQDFQFGTPIINDSSGLSDRKGPGFTTPKKQAQNNVQTTDKRPRPRQKGLRKLSARAFQIVKELGEATYKQVAYKLIQGIDDDQSDGGEEKQQNNIKRRVYDALNVLIAMEILIKKGRFIVYDPNSEVVKKQNMHLKFVEDKNQKLCQWRKKAEQVAQRRAEITMIKSKIQTVKKLIHRNQIYHKIPQRQKIKFPFVCLSVSPESAENKLKLSPGKGNFSIETSDSYSFFGDVDFLLKHPKKLA